MITSYRFILITSIIAINGIAYIIMCFDKYQSKRNGQRISENMLLLLAFVLGSVGIYCGMKAPLYHKAGKSKFKILIPLLLLMQCVTLLYFYKNF